MVNACIFFIFLTKIVGLIIWCDDVELYNLVKSHHNVDLENVVDDYGEMNDCIDYNDVDEYLDCK